MKTIEEMLAVMTAYKEGKTIEVGYKGSDWEEIDTPSWDWSTLDYRVKPEPKQPTYRPYKDAKEFIKAQSEHGMYLYFSKNCAYKLVTSINICSIAILWDSKQVEEIEYTDLFKRATWQDGQPCGVLEEE